MRSDFVIYLYDEMYVRGSFTCPDVLTIGK